MLLDDLSEGAGEHFAVGIGNIDGGLQRANATAVVVVQAAIDKIC